MSATTVQLLQAASDIVGGNRELAIRLGIGETLLATFLSDSRELPDLLLLRAVDVILENRQSHLYVASETAQPVPALPEMGEIAENRSRGSGAARGSGAG